MESLTPHKLYSFSRTSLDRLSSCDERLQRILLLAIQLTEVDFGISCGYRSPEEQQRLYSLGRTKPGKIVTYVDGVKKLSRHNYEPSKAADVFAWVDGRLNWDVRYYYRIADAVKQAAQNFREPIIWGGDWRNFKDYPHFQLP